ncbi:MAG: hypothetical protein WKF36_03965 [Candidatus Nitrosocosmicus sp.]
MFKFIAISSLVFVMILSPDDHYLKYIFSESFSSHYSAYFYSNGSKSNQTSIDTGCDFLNLCGKNIDSELSEVSLSFNNKIVDISYLNSYLQLPFP